MDYTAGRKTLESISPVFPFIGGRGVVFRLPSDEYCI